MIQINPDDYVGHTPGPWEWHDDYITEAYGDGSYIAKMEYDYKAKDAMLMTDAPLLLAEVERLRSIVDDLYSYIVSDASISWSTIEEEMDWREEE